MTTEGNVFVIREGQCPPRLTSRLRAEKAGGEFALHERVVVQAGALGTRERSRGIQSGETNARKQLNRDDVGNNNDDEGGLRSIDLLGEAVYGGRMLEKEEKRGLEKFLQIVVGMLGNDVSARNMCLDAAIECWRVIEDVVRNGKNAGTKARDVVKKEVGVALGERLGRHQIVDGNAVGALFDQFELIHDGRRDRIVQDTIVRHETPGRNIRSSKGKHEKEAWKISVPSASSVVSRICGGVAVAPWDVSMSRNPALDQDKEQDGGKTKINVASTISADQVAQAEFEALGGTKGVVANRDVGTRWLQSWASRVVPWGENVDEGILTRIALLLLSKEVSDDVLASELFDLLGDGVFEHAEQLLLQRKNFVANILQLIAQRRKEEEAESSAVQPAPSYGPSITVMSESEKAMLKAERKAERKKGKKYQNSGHGAKNAVDESEIDWLSRNGIGVLLCMEREKEEASKKLVLGNGIEFTLGGGESGQKGGLPIGTQRKVYKGYEEVKVPAVPTGPVPPGEKHVTMDELPAWAQLAFEGYTKLNRIQSKIFPVAFNSNENLLVCAPTGAGKTNIAMLCVLREISQHIVDDDIDVENFKIVYVAPMKALASEVTTSFSKRLDPLGLTVRELTGDMQLSKREMEECQMIVTTPEKWDVITRKGGEVSIAAKVKLIIIDEVHLLNDDRGSVIETLVARTTRQVETSQSMIRIVGLSATLPNHQDVAEFLGVSPASGLFYFDASYRPVPLETSFVGVSEKNYFARQTIMDEVCYQKVVDSIRKGHQAMVFVHSRKDAGKSARMLALKAQQNGDTADFVCTDHPMYSLASKDAKKSKNRELVEVFENGLGIHHAGMLRSDRTMVERFFSQGIIKVLCCTATLAWGVNLPAHTVIIKGTSIYNPQKGGFTDLGMLDVQQIFGRAGRPQFQDSGEASIITSHDRLAHYLGMISHSVPIESKFTEQLADHLNAEVVLGTVTNVKEGVIWLGYTYLFVRMRRNPLAYGIGWEELAMDPQLVSYRSRLISEAARLLDRSRMVRFDERSGNIYTAEMGRVSSHFYIRQASIETYNELLKPHMNEEDILYMISKSSEFENLNVRDEELPELDDLYRTCSFQPRGGPETKHGKANILLQAFISRTRVESFSLIADLNYVSQNAPRLARALYEICMNKGWPSAAETCLSIAKSIEWTLWPQQHPLWQFEEFLKRDVLQKLEKLNLDLLHLKEMKADEIGAALRHPAAGSKVVAALSQLPMLDIQASIMPITRTVLRVHLEIYPDFKWRDSVHGSALRWIIWVEDSDNERIYHSEVWALTKQMWKEKGKNNLTFAVPVMEPLPSQYYVKAVSDSWLGCETVVALSFKGLLLPQRYPPHTELLDLQPLPKSALNNEMYEEMYRFSHFNPIQTQAFHTLYYTDENILLGAPTGSGKTISAELTILRLQNAHPGKKIVFIAPLKALVRERMKDWGQGLANHLGIRIVEMTGDRTPDMRGLLSADIIVTTPEKWDGISRNWKNRSYVQSVGLIIMDEIHLLGADRGPVLEVIVSRMRYISCQTGNAIRFVGLSTALANAPDLADWLGVGRKGLFNFKPSVRPVPLECHIQGYPGKFYCPRMATMNKPSYAAIQTHSPNKPVLIFVASRRQTRLTALDLITYAAADGKPRVFLRMEDYEIESLLVDVSDSSLRHTLQFGVGIHHAGLSDNDRNLVERLFVAGKIQVLVATSTLAWGVNTPAHLVIVKGTEYYDAPTKRYVDYPITDILQMMGRAGRPQYDDHGVAVIMVYEPKKSFYKKFLYEPFPVESSLPSQLADHLNAEIAGGTIHSKQDCVEYLNWTFFMRRLLQNPSYYKLDCTDPDAVSIFLSEMVQKNLDELETSGCLESIEDELVATFLGKIASLYYLHYTTMKTFNISLTSAMQVKDIFEVLCSASEYDELPVRHNEDTLNAAMLPQVRFPPPLHEVDKPSCKAYLLLQAHLGRIPLPVSDYVTDTRSVLENSMRILQALIDITAENGWWPSCLSTMKAIQCIMQGRWDDANDLMQLPHVSGVQEAKEFSNRLKVSNLKSLISKYAEDRKFVEVHTRKLYGPRKAEETLAVLERLPHITASTTLVLGEKNKITVNMTRISGRFKSTSKPPRSFTPCFPKIKEEGWWCCAVNPIANEILALKRVSFGSKGSFNIQLSDTNFLQRLKETKTVPVVHLISDSYLGLDLQIPSTL